LISGNITLIARATQIVWICNLFSDATPAGNANWKPCPATGALAANNSASVGVATFAALGGTAFSVVGAAAAASGLRRGSVPWA
jgi:hypothetical protein